MGARAIAPEKRVFLTEETTGTALVNRQNCNYPCNVEPLNDVLESADAMWKVECHGLDRNDKPNLVYIRNYRHPQLTLNDVGNLVNSFSRDEALWHIEHSSTDSKIFAMKNKKSKKYLSVEVSHGHYKIAFHEEPSYWLARVAKPGAGRSTLFKWPVLDPSAFGGAAAIGAGHGSAVLVAPGPSAVPSATTTGVALATVAKTIRDQAVEPASKEWVVMKI